MWELSVITGLVVATVLFLRRTGTAKMPAGNDEPCRCGEKTCGCDSQCQSNKSLITGDSSFFGTDSLRQNASSTFSESSNNLVSPPQISACSLLAMEPGRKGTVLALTGGREFQAKLVSMGFNVGSVVTVLKSGVGGSGLLVATGDTRLAIGNGIAERIVVALNPADDVGR